MSRRRRNETEEQRARRELISDFLSAANNSAEVAAVESLSFQC